MEAHSATTRPAPRRPRASRGAPVLVLALLAALLLVLAELSTVASVDVADGSCRVINDSSPDLADRCDLDGFERHGGALLLLAVVTLAAALVAARGNPRAGGALLVALGALVLGITLLADLPETNETGAIGVNFDGATAQAGLGFYMELTAGVLALLAGALALSHARQASPAGHERQRVDQKTARP